MAMTMTRHVVIESSTMNRRHPLLSGGEATAKDDKDCWNVRRIGEVAGGTAGMCCCCPCAMMHLLILAVYKVPTGLCKKALKKHKRKRLLKRRKKNDLLDEKQRMKLQDKSGPDGTTDDDDDDDDESSDGGNDETVDFDSEMWDSFYGAGFWRSFSRREDS